MEMMLNPLPSRTWNRLGMNESFIKMDAPLENLIPSRDSSPAGVRWSENAEGWEGLQTGMGRDMGVLTADAPVCQAETGAGAVMTQPLILRYRYEDGQCSRSRLRLVAGKDSILSVIVVLESPDLSGGISALQTEIAAEAGARVHLSVAQLLGSSFVCLNDIGGRCEDSARIEVTKLELGASRLFAGTTIDLAGTESDFQTDAAYHVLPEQQVDLNYVALHDRKGGDFKNFERRNDRRREGGDFHNNDRGERGGYRGGDRNDRRREGGDDRKREGFNGRKSFEKKSYDRKSRKF